MSGSISSRECVWLVPLLQLVKASIAALALSLVAAQNPAPVVNTQYGPVQGVGTATVRPRHHAHAHAHAAVVVARATASCGCMNIHIEQHEAIRVPGADWSRFLWCAYACGDGLECPVGGGEEERVDVEVWMMS